MPFILIFILILFLMPVPTQDVSSPRINKQELKNKTLKTLDQKDDQIYSYHAGPYKGEYLSYIKYKKLSENICYYVSLVDGVVTEKTIVKCPRGEK